MLTIEFNDFIPKLIDQDTEIKGQLSELLKSGEEEVRVRDQKEAVYILGLKTTDNGELRLEIRRIKHLLAQLEPAEGDFMFNASLAAILMEKQKELHIKVYEEEIAREYNGL